MFYFQLVPLRGKIHLGACLQNNLILVSLRGNFQKIQQAPPSLLYGSSPPPGFMPFRTPLLKALDNVKCIYNDCAVYISVFKIVNIFLIKLGSI